MLTLNVEYLVFFSYGDGRINMTSESILLEQTVGEI